LPSGVHLQDDDCVQREGLSYRFSEAIVREPCRRIVRGIRAMDRGDPEFSRFQSEHAGYIGSLERAGLTVSVLRPLEPYPDSVFIEDAALCLPEGIVILRPGAPSRTGEAAVLAGELLALGHEVVHCESDGHVDGGDILVTDAAVLVGLSGRTDRAGFEWLQSALVPWGYRVRPVRTPDAVIHFKSDCCVLDSHTVLATDRLAATECFADFRVLVVPRGEEEAANSIRINDTVLVPAGFPATARLIRAAGYQVDAVPVSQAALLDGGLSCMSLRFRGRPARAP